MFLSLFFVDFKSTLLSSKGEEVESANSLFLFYVFYRSVAHSEVHTFLAYSSVHFYICIHLCKHHTDEDIKHFHYSRRKQLILKSLLEQGEWASKLVGSLLWMAWAGNDVEFRNEQRSEATELGSVKIEDVEWELWKDKTTRVSHGGKQERILIWKDFRGRKVYLNFRGENVELSLLLPL